MRRRQTLPPLSSLVAVLLCAASTTGCGDDGAATSGTTAGPTGPTFHEHVGPILQKSCQGCHQGGGIAPFALATYDDARSVSGLMVEETATRRMPPWGALDTDECKPRHPWKEDQRLTDEELATLAAWHDAGAPEGDPAKAPPPIEPPAMDLDDADVELTAAAPFVTSGDYDQFRCFVLDPGLSAPTYLNGLHVVPGNPAVVHHVLVYADPEAESAGKELGPDGGYDCFGGAGIGSPTLVGAFVPGGVPNELPSNVGTPLDAGTLLVMQIHYHPGGKTAEPDLTKLQLRFVDEAPDWLLAVQLFGNAKSLKANGDGLMPGPNDKGEPEFLIPAGATGHVETMVVTLPETIGGAPLPLLRVFGAGSHMHLVGVDEKIDVERGDAGAAPQNECLLQTPQWDFSWQRSYVYDAPMEELPTLEAGDKLRIRCTYDNSLANPQLGIALKEQGLAAPVDVTMGEATLEEMCIVGLSLLYPAP